MRRNIWLIAISSIVLLVIINNVVFFYITRYLLQQELEQQLISLGAQIRQAAEQKRIGLDLFEEQISRELRAASIAAKYALDDDVENISAEQLTELAKELDLSHITLLKKLENNDILLYQSSDPKQINKSTASWDPWHRIFQELFAGKNIDEEWLGTSLPNFWSGPYEVSSTDYTNIYKWGYFYDGTTNYMIDPYVDYTAVNIYNEATGLDRLFEDLIHSNESLLEISIVNPLTFPNDKVTIEEDGSTRKHIVQRPVLYGSYNYKSKYDELDVRKAFNNGERFIRTERTKDAYTYKMFIPVSVEEERLAMVDEEGQPMEGYVLVITANYEYIAQSMRESVIRVALLTLMITAVMVPAVILVMNYFKNLREEAVKVAQDTYIEEINALFQSIRSQRHDFINQVQTIHSLIKLKHYDEVEKFTAEIAGEIHFINDYINIGNPAVAALIRSKLSQAEAYHIEFIHDVKAVKLTALAGQALDINRIVGNLIDNAFDEVLKYDESLRNVTLYGREEQHILHLKICNYCENAKEKINLPLYKSGFSTKLGDHHGLGLSIIASIVKQYKGEIQMHALDETTIAFEVRIPLKRTS